MYTPLHKQHARTFDDNPRGSRFDGRAGLMVQGSEVEIRDFAVKQ